MSHRLIRLLVAAGVVCLLVASCATAPAGSGLSKAREKQIELEEMTANLELELRSQALAHFGTGVIHELNDESDEATAQYAESVLADPSNIPLLKEVVRRYLLKKQVDKALEILEHASAEPDASPEVFSILASVQTQSGKYAEAIQNCRIAIRRDPGYIPAYRALADVYRLQKNLKELKRVVEQAVAAKLESAAQAVDVLDLVAAYVQLEPTQLDWARRQVSRVVRYAIAEVKDDLLTKNRLADALLALDFKQEAEEQLVAIVKEMKVFPGVRERLIQIYWAAKQPEKAQEQMKEFARENPANPQSWFFLGSVATQNKKFAQAVEYFTKVISLRNDFEPAYYDLVSSYISLDQGEKALGILDQASQKFPGSFLTSYYRGIAYAHLKQYESAVRNLVAAEVLAQGRSSNALTAVFYFHLGTSQERAGRLDDAEKSLKKSIEMAPDFAEALNYLGYTWADNNLKLDEARVLIDKALKLEPDNAAFLDSLGWVLYRQGKAKEALKPLLRAMALSEKPDTTVLEHVGDVYVQLGDLNKARDAYQKSLTLEKSDAIQKKLLKLSGGK